MSFSSDIKGELCRSVPSKRCCAQSEVYGIALFCNSFTEDVLRIVTESTALANHLPTLFWKAFRLEFDQRPDSSATGKVTFAITDRQKLAILHEAFGIDHQNQLAHHINFALLEEEHCAIAFLRGAFLAVGSAIAPTKEYHLELVTSHYNVSRELPALLQEMGFAPKTTVRKSNYVTYFKQSEHIEDFLTVIGAPLSAMEIMNAKVEKQLRSSVNRRVNCDAANLDKAVDAAQETIAAIRRLERTVGLDGLSDKLQEAARLRVEHPELTLSQLAERCNPPVTKSSLNHRLRKILALSKG